MGGGGTGKGNSGYGWVWLNIRGGCGTIWDMGSRMHGGQDRWWVRYMRVEVVGESILTMSQSWL